MGNYSIPDAWSLAPAIESRSLRSEQGIYPIPSGNNARPAKIAATHKMGGCGLINYNLAASAQGAIPTSVSVADKWRMIRVAKMQRLNHHHPPPG